MIIRAQFKRSWSGTYGGRKYSYFCDIPDVKPGDFVRVPARDGEAVVRVAEVNVPENTISPEIQAVMKYVIAIAEDPDKEQETSHAIP